MQDRLHVPFDVFAMREDVCVSSLVRAGGLGWTCGQCPLDPQGRVIAPHDLLAQAQIVCDMIDDLVPRARFGGAEIGKLNVHYAEGSTGDGSIGTGAAAIGLMQKGSPISLMTLKWWRWLRAKHYITGVTIPRAGPMER